MSDDRHVPTSPKADWQDVRPGRVYDAADVALLFGVSTATVLAWAKARKLVPLPRMSPRQPVKFLGSTLLSLLGGQAAAFAAQATPSAAAGA